MRRAAFAVLGLCLISASASAQVEPGSSRLFPREATIDTSGAEGRLVRLPLTVEVLRSVQPNLSDVRLYDDRGAELPYLVDTGDGRPQEERRWTLTPVGIERTRSEPQGQPARTLERMTVELPAEAPSDAHWALSFDAASARFVRTVQVVRRDDEGSVPVGTGSIFRLPAPLRERLNVELEPFAEVDGRPRVLEIELEGEGAYLESTVALIATRRRDAPPTLVVPLEQLSYDAAEGRTAVTLARPRGLVLEELRVRTDTRNFTRRVRVSASRQGRPSTALRDAVIYRRSDLPGAEESSISLPAHDGDRLRLEIDDGDSSPLGGLRVYAVVRRPTLVFEPNTAATTFRFGGGRALAPRYDLQALRAVRLDRQSSRLSELTLPPSVANPRFDEGPALDFALQSGRVVDRTSYTHATPIRVSGAVEGLSRIHLPPSVVATARANLGDLRIVDGDGRQWPFLHSFEPAYDTLSLSVSSQRVGEAGTTYELELPVSRARIESLQLEVAAAFVDRPFLIYGMDARGRWERVAEGRLRRSLRSEAPIRIGLGREELRRLRLIVEDSSDAPLSIDSIEARVPRVEVYLVAPDGDYDVLTGDESASSPAYEIARIVDFVLAVRAVDVTAPEAASNPSYDAPSWFRDADAATFVLWVVLLMAVLVLAFVTMRFARSGEGVDPGPSAKTDDPAVPTSTSLGDEAVAECGAARASPDAESE